MNTLVHTIKESLLHLVYPKVCIGCATDLLPSQSHLCLKCIHDLPLTHFENHLNNPIEKILTGRVQFQRATSQLYFTKHSLLQKIMHHFKYKGNKELGLQLGVMMGHQLMASGQYRDVEALIPLPLHEKKERIRGYNQSEILCQGISEVFKIPIVKNIVQRTIATDTQTRKTRVARWQNMSNTFTLVNDHDIENKTVLLVDDIVTTGATIEACANALLYVKGLKLYVATLCYASYV